MRTNTLYIKLLLIIFVVLVTSITIQGQNIVYISEIMYDTPENEQIAIGEPYSNGEFIELYNGGKQAIDLSGWSLHGGGKTEVFMIPTGTHIIGGTDRINKKNKSYKFHF